MKKIISILSLTFLMMLSLSFASPILSHADDAEHYFAFDLAGVLSTSEEAALEQKLTGSYEKHGTPIYVVILPSFLDREDNVYGTEDFLTYAHDFYEYYGLGKPDTYDGILLLLSTADRDWAFSTDGYAIDVYNQQIQKYVFNQMLPSLKNDDYNTAVNIFADITDEVFTAYANGETYEAPRNPLPMYWIAISIGVGLLIAFGVLAAMTSSLRTVAPKAGADSYVTNNFVNFTNQDDIFLYRNIMRTEKPKDDDGTSSSSSGRSHGGSSGKY